MILGLIKQILTNVDDRQIAIMQNLGNYVCHKLVDRIHEIVDNQQGRLSSVEYLVPICRKSSVEVHKRSVTLKHLLIFFHNNRGCVESAFQKTDHCVRHSAYAVQIESFHFVYFHLLKMSTDV